MAQSSLNSMNQNSVDRPIQIMKYNNSSKTFVVDSAEINEILKSNDVRDCDIAIISIAGAFRKGKSFMLSFFLRYLYAVYDDNKSDWLGDESSQLVGFSWVGGCKRHTSGMWVWSKIFTKTRSNGQQIGVMLVDTQGTWDSETTLLENVTIFSLSQMLSSVQIYNIFNNIQEDDLQHLQLFTEYGKLAMRENFQTLMFLIRDWSYAYEHEHGLEGGKELLKKALEINEERQPIENQKIREHLISCYDKIECCLMPSPGLKATSSQQFRGKLCEIDENFKNTLKIFVPALLHPDNIVVKKVGGYNVKAKNFTTHIDCYFDMVRKGTDMTNPRTILAAIAEANNLTAKEEALEFYRKNMYSRTVDVDGVMEFNVLVHTHLSIKEAALITFQEKAVIGDQHERNAHYNKLQSELEQHLILYIGQNEAKKAKNLNEIIQNLTSELESFKSTTTEQAKTISLLQQQLHDFQNASADEKEKMLEQMAKLQEDRDNVGLSFQTEIQRIQRDNLENSFKQSLEVEKLQHDLQSRSSIAELRREQEEALRTDQERRHAMELQTARLENDLRIRDMEANIRRENETQSRAIQDEMHRLKLDRQQASQDNSNSGMRLPNININLPQCPMQ